MTIKATFDRATYTAGDKMTLTVTTDEGERDRYSDTPVTVRVSVAGVGEADVTTTLRKPAADAPVVIDDPDRTWTPVSDDGATAVFEAVA